MCDTLPLCARVSYKTPSRYYLKSQMARFSKNLRADRTKIRGRISGIRTASIAKMYIFALVGEIP